MPRVFVLGGPNGAGKSTAARGILPAHVSISRFVNADEIARGLSAYDPGSVAVEAGRLMLRRLDALAEEGEDFAFETTLASRTFLPRFRKLQQAGYKIEVLYVWVPSPDMSVGRVASRVASGGHHVPAEVIRRRYERGRENFLREYRPLADTWEVYENTGAQPDLVAFGGHQRPTTILNPTLWLRMSGETL